MICWNHYKIIFVICRFAEQILMNFCTRLIKNQSPNHTVILEGAKTAKNKAKDKNLIIVCVFTRTRTNEQRHKYLLSKFPNKYKKTILPLPHNNYSTFKLFFPLHYKLFHLLLNLFKINLHFWQISSCLGLF